MHAWHEHNVALAFHTDAAHPGLFKDAHAQLQIRAALHELFHALLQRGVLPSKLGNLCRFCRLEICVNVTIVLLHATITGFREYTSSIVGCEAKPDELVGRHEFNRLQVDALAVKKLVDSVKTACHVSPRAPRRMLSCSRGAWSLQMQCMDPVDDA